jgi:hypothetical protein
MQVAQAQQRPATPVPTAAAGQRPNILVATISARPTSAPIRSD